MTGVGGAFGAHAGISVRRVSGGRCLYKLYLTVQSDQGQKSSGLSGRAQKCQGPSAGNQAMVQRDNQPDGCGINDRYTTEIQGNVLICVLADIDKNRQNTTQGREGQVTHNNSDNVLVSVEQGDRHISVLPVRPFPCQSKPGARLAGLVIPMN